MNNQTSLITVLTLSYYSPDLYAAVNSVLTQDYQRIQYILIDDFTEDFSENVLSEYIETNRNKNLEEYIIIRNPENYGTVRAANIGLRLAKGEVIFGLAGDDVFADTTVISEWTTAFIQSGALMMTAYRDVYDAKMEHYIERLPTSKQVKEIRNLSSMTLFEKQAKGNYIFGCCTAYSRKCFEQYGYYDERYRLIEDHSMLLRLLRQGVNPTFFDKVVVKYRNNGTSSPLRYNEVYERDVNLIFEFEIMPYTKNPKKMKRIYKKWKRKQRMARNLYIKLQQENKKTFYIFIHKLWFYLHFPIASIRGLLANPLKLKKMFRI